MRKPTNDTNEDREIKSKSRIKIRRALAAAETAAAWGAGGCLALIVLCLAACSLVGTNPSAPTGVERAVFTTVTNYVPQTNLVTEVVPVYKTNEVTVTHTNEVAGEPPQIVTLTNFVTVVTQQTNVTAVVTNVPAYTQTVSPQTQATVQAGGSLVNMFVPGVGGLVSSGILGLLSLWGYLRSSKLKDTSSALAQEIETIRTFIQQLPNGQAYDGALVNFMQAHQAEAGVVTQVLQLLKTEVSNPSAQTAAQEVMRTIQQLQLQTSAPAPAVAKA